MRIGMQTKNRTMLTAAALALVLLGLALSFLTWQNLERQRQTIEEHLFLSSQVILRGIEAGMARELRGHMAMFPGMRGMHGFRGGQGRGPGPGAQHNPQPGAQPGQAPEAAPSPVPGQDVDSQLQALQGALSPAASVMPRLKEMLTELIETSDVQFVSFYAQNGQVIFSARTGGGPEIPPLPASGWRALSTLGEWAALYQGPNGANFFVSGIRTKPGLAQLCEDDSQLDCTPGGIGVPFLVVGLNPSKHLDTFRKFKRTALLQTGYVLVVAAFLWGLGAAYLRRRDQSRALHRLETFHSRLLDTMPDGLLTVDADGVIRAANPAAGALLLSDEGDLVGRRFEDLPLESRGDLGRSGAVGGGLCAPGAEWELVQTGGRSLEILRMPIPADASAEGQAGERLVLVRDRTELRALEDDLAEAKQQAAIGRLAAGLAHEIRNPLSALRGFAQFFKKKLEGRQPEEQYAATMVSEADRLDKVITDLMFLSRPRAPEQAVINTAALAADLRGLMEFDLKHQGAELAFDIQAPSVLADPDMIKQALLNLLLNSLAAVAQNPEGEPRRIELAAFQDGDRSCLAVRDTGPGMTEQEKAHALEPFFTSKKEGTGLGLAIVHRIMRNHHGRVSIDARREGPDHGTEIRLCFPSSRPAACEIDSEPQPEETP